MKRGFIKSRFLRAMVMRYSLVFIIIVTLFAAILAFTVYVQRRDTDREYQSRLASGAVNQIESFLDEMDSAAMRVSSDSNVVIRFSELAAGDTDGNYFERDITGAIDMSSVLTTINTQAGMWRINVYDSRGNFLSVGAPIQKERVAEVLAESNTVEDIVNLKYRRNSATVERDMWSDYFGSSYAVVRRAVMNEYSKKAYAIVEVWQDVAALGKTLDLDMNGMQFVIYDKESNPIYKTNPPQNRADKPSAYSVSSKYGWSVEVYPSADEDMWKIVIGFAVFYVILIIASVTVTYRVGVKVISPLDELRHTVAHMSLERHEVTADEGVIDEIKELSIAFSDALARMDELAAEERRATIHAMQSQMNQHFLFNTLSVISSKGMECGCGDIAQMCTGLSDMLRYAADYENAYESLASELRYTERYLELMKARYEDYFTYEIRADWAAAEKISVPKLIIQPIAENCFKHGFKNTEPPWKISIEFAAEGDNWRITVADNGCGIDDETLVLLKKRLDSALSGENRDYARLSLGGLGLVSAAARIKMTDGWADYSIETDRSGTRVTLFGRITKGEST